MSDPATANIDRHPGTARGKTYVRWLVRILLLVAAGAMLWPVAEPSWIPLAVPALSPWVALAAVLATWTFSVATCIGLSVAVVALVRRRWFCRWVCPTGTCADVAGGLGTRLGRRCPSLPAWGQWIALLTLGGAVCGYPLLLWLDPLAMFSASLSVLRAKTDPLLWWSAIGMAAVLLMSVLWPGAWCARICPLGAMQDLLSWLVAAVRSAMFESNGDDQPARAHRGLSRRVVLGGLMGAIATAAVRTLRGAVPRGLRPPGAVDESQFGGLCVRCGNCLRACPTDIIRPDAGSGAMAGLLAPVLSFREGYCREDCTRCTDVCPSGALVRLAPEDKLLFPIGVPRVNMELCLLGEDRECSICRNWCPYEAIKLVFSETEYTLTPQVDLQKCPGCGACEMACPTTPAKAIVVVAKECLRHDC